MNDDIGLFTGLQSGLTRVSISTPLTELASEHLLDVVNIEKNKNILFMNTHMLIEAFSNNDLRQSINSADIIFADGKPIYLLKKFLRVQNPKHVRGFDFTLVSLSHAERQALRVAFVGSTPENLQIIRRILKEHYTSLEVVLTLAPSFGEIGDDQVLQIAEAINSSGADLVFLGFGCPKQEILMHKLRLHTQANLICVGAVFDFLSGNKKQSPKLVSQFGFEWLFRMITDFKRLAPRYFRYNTIFLYFVVCLIFGSVQVVRFRNLQNAKSSKI